MIHPLYSAKQLQGNWPAQEDSFRFNPEKGIFMVADGFGGPVPGAYASSQACELVESFLTKTALDTNVTLPFVLRSYMSLASNVLFNALHYANKRLVEQNKNKNINERGGASMIAGLLDGQFLALAHLGSCSAWLLRGEQAAQLVYPRTYGRLTDPTRAPVEAKDAEVNHAPLAALGMYEDLEPEILEFRLEQGDWIILQTDGLSGQLQNNLIKTEIVNIKQKNLTKERSIESVFELIGQKQGLAEDNYSILLALV